MEKTVEVTPQESLEAGEKQEELSRRITSFNDGWQLSGKERRRRGLTDLQSRFMNGHTDLTGRKLLEGMEKPKAQDLVCLLSELDRLNTTSDTPDDVREYLDKALREEQNLRGEKELLSSRGNKSRLDIPELFALQSHLGELTGNWPAFRTLIRETWPANDGANAAARLEISLLGSKDQPLQAEQANSDSGTGIEEIQPPAEEQRQLKLEKDIAEQLDRIVLPPGADMDTVKRELSRLSKGSAAPELEKVDWNRLLDLKDFADSFDGGLYRSKETSLGNAPAYYVAVLDIEGDVFAIAESPVFGNATYVVSEKHAAGNWLEVLELSKQDARAVGAFRIIHRNEPGSRSHKDKVLDKIVKLHATAP